uniref:Secreted protein n=1 Tax=Globodera rostochiensis TaxID=31243 RepID=A0A914H900_GLORO
MANHLLDPPTTMQWRLFISPLLFVKFPFCAHASINGGGLPPLSTTYGGDEYFCMISIGGRREAVARGDKLPFSGTGGWH